MPFDPANLTPTPQGYATPAQIKEMYEYSKHLGQGDAQFKTITSPYQGVSNMVNALMGGWLSNRANDLTRGTTQYDTRSLPSAPAWPSSQPQQPPYLYNTPVTPIK